MATVLDVGLLRSFGIIFPALFVFALVYSLLHKTKALGESIVLNAIIAVVAAFMVILSDNLVKMINFMIPWFVVAIIFFVLVLLIFQAIGVKDTAISEAVKDKSLMWVIIGVCIVIIVAAFGNVFGQSLVEAGVQSRGEVNVTVGADGAATSNFQQNIYATLFHPKVLGLIILFGVAIFAIALLTG